MLPMRAKNGVEAFRAEPEAVIPVVPPGLDRCWLPRPSDESLGWLFSFAPRAEQKPVPPKTAKNHRKDRKDRKDPKEGRVSSRMVAADVRRRISA